MWSGEHRGFRLVVRSQSSRQRLLAAQATGASQLGRVGSLLRVVLLTMIAAEVVVASLLLPRFLLRGEGVWEALWHSVFYSVSSFNNAGFTVHTAGMAHFADDPWVLSVIGASVFVGSLGFPVVFVMSILWRTPRARDLDTKLTLATSAFHRRISSGSIRLAVSVLLAAGTIVLLGTIAMLSGRLGTHHARVRPGAAISEPPLPVRGGAPDHRLTSVGRRTVHDLTDRTGH